MTVHIRRGKFRILLPVCTRFAVKIIFRQAEGKKDRREERERVRALCAALCDAKKKFGHMTIFEVYDGEEDLSFKVKL